MDVSALSVSIDVDMSGFINAMEEVAAMLIAVAEEFEKVAQDLQGSFAKINESGEETKSFWGQVIEYALKAIEIFDGLKKAIGFVVDALKYFKLVGQEATATGLLGSLLELAGVSAELATPIGWVALAVTALALAYEDLYGSAKKANEEQQKTATIQSDDTLNGSHTIGLTNPEFKKPLTGSDTTYTTGDYRLNSAEIPKSYKQTSTDSTSPAVTVSGSQNSSTTDNGSQDMTTDFLNRTQSIYNQLQQAFPPKNAQIKVSANATAENERLPDDSSSVQNINLINQGYKKLAPTIQAATDKVKEQNEASRESAELFKDLQSVASGAFSTIGDALGKMMAEQRINYYAGIVIKDPSQAKFLKGWLNRVNTIVAMYSKAV
ncbi:MAG TPA: hypothetical protein VK783_05060 [Bacteroidia bacterium]|jgi:hypothetical protein|nr:hypothetical protein [Bacteroidia bacterium]